MYVEFNYSGDISFLNKSERKQLAKNLEECTALRNWDYFDVERKKFYVSGSCGCDDNAHEDSGDYKNIEKVLAEYDIDWQGGAREIESEPDWDKMPGGYDALYN